MEATIERIFEPQQNFSAEIGWACSKYGEDETSIRGFLVEGDHLGKDPGIAGKIILK
jgi:hypothetical protein